jgi:hypothetical protein
MQGLLRFDLYKFWNKQVRFPSISKTKPRSKLRSAFVSISLTLLVRASDSQCRSRNCPGFDPSILRHSGICGAADEAVLNIVHKKKNPKKSPFNKKFACPPFLITDELL